RRKAEKLEEISSGSEDDSDYSDSDSESDSDSDSEDDNSGNDSDSESEEEEPIRKRKKKHAPKAEKITRTHIPPPNKKHQVHFKKLEAKGKKAAEFDEVESLMKQMQAMSLDDPTYATLYYRACRLDPTGKVENIVSPPRPRAPQPSFGGSPYSGPRTPNSGITCFGCGERGHRINACTKIVEYISKGYIIRVAKDGYQ
ncbi:hypothetical protein SCHPADRAFT_948446, partial [Schizopora paradoxa]